MSSQMIKDGSYNQKINSVTFLRIISFTIWKFIFGLFYFYLISYITRINLVSKYVLFNLKLNFYFSEYLKLFVLFTASDLLKLQIFVDHIKYNCSLFHIALKTILEAKFKSVVFVILSLIAYISLWIIQGSITSIKGFQKDSNYLHISLYR